MTDQPTRQDLRVLPGTSLVVVDGAAQGDALAIADDLVMDDVYRLAPRAGLAALVIERGRGGGLSVAAGSPSGGPGRRMHLDACLTLMAPDGRTVEVLVLVEVEAGVVAEIWALPLGALEPRTDYRLVGIDRHSATSRLAEVACASFVRGTRITLADGEQRAVEELRVGDRVLTRDDGPQPIRWIGQRTLRAAGAFAPILIRKGALHNANDLLLAPDHRVLVYQRRDRLGAGRAEVMVKVRHLVNGTTVVVRDGGFVEYVQLLLDDHQIVFAEGIAAESLLVDTRTRAALPAALGEHGPRPHQAYEVREALLSGADVVELLRRASQAG